jgi:hypothetical protein
MVVRFSALRAGRALPPGRFVVLISVRGCGWKVWLNWKRKCNYLVRNQTRDLPACSIAPQPARRSQWSRDHIQNSNYPRFSVTCAPSPFIIMGNREYTLSGMMIIKSDIKTSYFVQLILNLFSIYLILPAALGPGFYSASNRNKYQKQKKKCFCGVVRGRRVRLATSPPSVSRLSR